MRNSLAKRFSLSDPGKNPGNQPGIHHHCRESAGQHKLDGCVAFLLSQRRGWAMNDKEQFPEAPFSKLVAILREVRNGGGRLYLDLIAFPGNRLLQFQIGVLHGFAQDAEPPPARLAKKKVHQGLKVPPVHFTQRRFDFTNKCPAGLAHSLVWRARLRIQESRQTLQRSYGADRTSISL